MPRKRSVRPPPRVYNRGMWISFRRFTRVALAGGFTALTLGGSLDRSNAAAQWKPTDGPLFTRWAKDVSPTKVLPEYPRPQMKRGEN